MTKTNLVAGTVHYLRYPFKRRDKGLSIFDTPYNKERCHKYTKKGAEKCAARLNAKRNILMVNTIVYGIEAAGE